jgi:hypothetical protein
MEPPPADSTGLYKEFLAERQEILCHKWIESEKAGYDIGFERALLDWTLKYRSAWREKQHHSPDAPLMAPTLREVA